MSAYEFRKGEAETGGRQLGCADLPCVDVGIGIYHHPMCGLTWEEAEGPMSPEEEEMAPPDLVREKAEVERC